MIYPKDTYVTHGHMCVTQVANLSATYHQSDPVSTPSLPQPAQNHTDQFTHYHNST